MGSCGMLLFEMLCGISILDKMLEWIGLPVPCPQKMVYTFLTSRPHAFLEVLHQVHRTCRDESLDELLLGMLEPDVVQRWSAQQTTECAWVKMGRDAGNRSD